MNQIIKGIGQGFKKLSEETGEKLVTETGKIAESIITAKELLGDIKPMSENELATKKMEYEKKKQEEMNRLHQDFGGQGRNVENEMEQIRHQRENEEKEKEKAFLKNLERQREEERQQQILNGEGMIIKKHHKDKGGNKHKTQQPDESQMSQTSEFNKGGKID
jgi:hypothetical protein